MRIAGVVPKRQNVEVEYIRSVHTVSRWIHELFAADGIPTAPPPRRGDP